MRWLIGIVGRTSVNWRHADICTPSIWFSHSSCTGTLLLFIVLLCSGVMGFAFTHDSRLKMIDYQGAVPYNVYSFLLPCHLPCIFWFVTKLHYALININYIWEQTSMIDNVRRCAVLVLRYIYLDNCPWKAHKWCDTWRDLARPTEEFD